MFGFLRRRGGGLGLVGALTGYYDLHGDTISGAVHKLPYASMRGMRVEVLRQGRQIAMCEVPPKSRHDGLPFNMKIDGRFTEADIVRETILVTVRNDRGDTGTLTLMGATQLELVRRHLGARMAPVFDLDFAQLGEGRALLGAGWSVQTQAAWAIDDASWLQFTTPQGPGPYLLRLKAQAFITPLVPRQLLEIFIDDGQVAMFTAEDGMPRYEEIRLTSLRFGANETSVMRLYHPYAGRPCDYGESPDTRRLAFAFFQLSLMRVLNDD